MSARRKQGSRRGAILPLVAICLVGLMGLLALAIDVGLVAVARSQAQNAADAASMAGARTINGSATYNYAAMPVNAVQTAVNNQILGKAIVGDPNKIQTAGSDVFTSGQVTIQGGAYAYIYDDNNSANEGFKITMPGRPNGEPYSAARVTVAGSSSVNFGRIFGASSFPVQATATAIHRPRDVVIIMDLSGSMRFQSLPGIYLSGSTAYPSSAYPRTKSMNPDPDYPQFGHYSATSTAALYGNTSYSTGSEMVDPCNLSYTSNSGPPIIEGFYSSGSTKAFTRGDSAKSTTPGGDDCPKYNGNYVLTVNSYLNGATGETTLRNWLNNGYGSSFAGYTEGPGYWGKTFFVWPPDPRGSDLDPTVAANHADNGAKDWRQRFFFKFRNSTLYWLDHNTLLFNPSGSPATSTSSTTAIFRAPNTDVTVTENGASVTYQMRINYAAILKWLRTSPMHFPSQMTTGRIKYYTSIPNPDSDTTINSRFWANSSLSDSEAFWKEYIDFMLGFVASGTTYNTNRGNTPYSSMIGSGDLYKWGSTNIQISQAPDCNYTGLVNNSGGYTSGGSTLKVDTVKNFSGSTMSPSVGHFIRINYRNQIHKITNISSSSGTHTLTLDTPLVVSVGDNAMVQFYTSIPRYMNHTDNPYRPRLQYWFGPLSFVDWLGNYQTGKFWWPGNVHEAQNWACKAGIQTAIDDIKNNHPNDFIGMTFFSDPRTGTSDSSGLHNRAVIPLGRNYDQLKASLWFPPSTITGGVSTINATDADFQNVPRASGGTAPGMGLMIAYNLLSNSTNSLRLYAEPSGTYRGNAGGLGRKGANRLVILETDGAPNTRAFASMGGSGKDSYYKVRVKYPEQPLSSSNEYPSGGTYSSTEVYNVVKQICADETASPPGFSNPRKTALVYALGYGTLFDPASSSTAQSNALTFLQTVQFHGNTASTQNGADFPTWQRIYGTNTQRIDRLRAAFTNIMQAGIQVSLIE